MKDARRTASIDRVTSETKVSLSICIDGTGKSEIKTGIPFFDHMLSLFAKHGLFDLVVDAEGDIDVDYHHVVEDVGIVLGSAIKEALADKIGINRYGFFILPMDETLVRIALDLSGRPYFVYNVPVKNPMIRDFNVCLIREFFLAVCNSVGMNLHIALEYGEEPHHISEGIFKCFSRALAVACKINERAANSLPSTKGSL